MEKQTFTRCSFFRVTVYSTNISNRWAKSPIETAGSVLMLTRQNTHPSTAKNGKARVEPEKMDTGKITPENVIGKMLHTEENWIAITE